MCGDAEAATLRPDLGEHLPNSVTIRRTLDHTPPEPAAHRLTRTQYPLTTMSSPARSTVTPASGAAAASVATPGLPRRTEPARPQDAGSDECDHPVGELLVEDGTVDPGRRPPPGR